MPRLRWIQSLSVGVEGITCAGDAQALRERGVMLTSSSGVQTPPMVEHMFGQLLMWTRRLHRAWDLQRERRWGYEEMVGSGVGLLAGRTMGLLGVGDIGAATARAAKAFGMKTIGFRRSGAPDPNVDTMYGPPDLRRFLAQSDVLVNTLPFTPGTDRLLGREEFESLPAGAVYVNGGRGATTDTDALMESLRSGHLGAALLDVTLPEPLPSDHPLWSMPNVLITPHYAGFRPDVPAEVGELFLQNMKRYLADAPLRNLVDWDAAY
jgi:phosphoglycerate dehydrogenase-like enzyme